MQTRFGTQKIQPVQAPDKLEPEILATHDPFTAGTMVLVSLGNPREKFWGSVLSLTPAGLSIRGIDLQSFEDSAAMVKAGEPFTPATMFFPMHRIERMELDANSGRIPSLCRRFAAQSGRDPVALFSAAASSPESGL